MLGPCVCGLVQGLCGHGKGGVGRAHLEADLGDDAKDLLDQRRRRSAAFQELLCSAPRSVLRGAAARHV